jgi:hypothetical protein
MVKISNQFGDRYSGKVGTSGVFATWKGIQYRRSYVKPSNPNTTKQQSVRNNLSNAITQWHAFLTLMRQAYSYMSAGLAMSGFNLFVRRWQNSMPDSEDTMVIPSVGIKQCGHTSTAKENTNPVPTAHSYTLGFGPVEIGSAAFTKNGTDKIMDAYVEITQGFVRLPLEISDHGGANAAGNALDAGDKLLISYESGGRVITREELYVVPEGESSIDAAATMALALRTKFAPIDYGSVTIELEDVSESPHDFTALESAEIDPINHKVYYDTTDPADSSSKWNYNVYTPLEDVKLEMVKTDTSFIAWRGYSDENGFLPLSATHEDETYDLTFTLSGHTAVIANAKTAQLAALTEFVDMGA